MSLLRASGLRRTYPSRPSALRATHHIAAVDGVDLEVAAGDRVGVVGESGCGKSTLLRLLLALETPNEGSVHYRDRPVRPSRARDLRWFRSEVQMVAQDPWSSLNPRMPVGEGIAEPLRNLRIPGDHHERADDLLRTVGLDPRARARRPGELSGGQLQRIALARALAPSPKVLLADEPVTALDASVRAQVLRLLRDLVEHEGLGLLLVTHDIAVVRQLCDRILVMRAGRVVEHGSTSRILTSPQHDHTRALIDSVPRLTEACSATSP